MLKVKKKPKLDQRKLNMGKQIHWGHHRSGWRYVVSLLDDLNNPAGVAFNGFLDGHLMGVLPLKIGKTMDEPFVGVFHNTPQHNQEGIEAYRNKYDYNSVEQILAGDTWSRSEGNCKGLWVFSEYLADFIRPKTKVPVSVLFHPTESVDKANMFSWDKFEANKHKQLLFIGHWMRNYKSMFDLCAPGYKKRILMGGSLPVDDEVVIELQKKYVNHVLRDQFVPHEMYDALLVHNICFVDLFDASANNIVIECMARGTPILVNKIPAVVEYLGEDYPFYYENLDEATSKLEDLQIARLAHDHIMNNEMRSKITSDSCFVREVMESEVYKRL